MDDDSYVTPTEMEEHHHAAHRDRVEFFLSEINQSLSGLKQWLMVIASLLGLILFNVWRR